MFKKILVCLDGSELAEQILPYAKQQASQFSGEVHLLNVLEPGKQHEGVRSEKLEAPAYLEDTAASLRKEGIAVNCATTEGTVGEAILAYADRQEIDIIAMATHGRSGLRRTMFGSVADFVLRKSGLPILIVKPEEAGTRALKKVQPFKKILACLDGSGLAEQIMPYATEEALGFQSKLVLFQVVPEPVTIIPGIPGTAPVPIQTGAMLEEAKEASDKAGDYLEKLAAPLRKKGVRVEVVTIWGRTGESILSYAENNGVNLIAMATRGRSGWGRAVLGSVADYVLKGARLPILIISPQEGEY